MKSLFLNIHDKKGGAAIAAYRILEGIRQHTDCMAEMFVGHKTTAPYYVKGPETRFEKLDAIFRSPFDALALIPYPKRKQVIFSSATIPNHGLFKKISKLNPDIIHLHWINKGFFSLGQVKKFKKPVVWTLHDMWVFTGGCHYCAHCNKYIDYCGNCPVLCSNKQKDLAYRNFYRKQNIFEKLDCTVVCPSNWLAKCAKSSKILKNIKISVIKYGIDLDLFRPIDKIIAREILNLPKNKKLILFGALNSLSDERKGFKYLFEALNSIESHYEKDCELVIFGSQKPETPVKTSFKINYMGTLKDEITLALLYSACDLMLVPSKEDNLPNTAVEATCCATPVVAFNIGGLPDIVEHKYNGYLAGPYEVEDLAQGIRWVLNLSHEEYLQISSNARCKAEKDFDIKMVSQKYYELYKEILQK